jgi:hypothetical protein
VTAVDLPGALQGCASGVLRLFDDHYALLAYGECVEVAFFVVATTFQRFEHSDSL